MSTSDLLSPLLDKGLYERRPQAGQAVSVSPRETQILAFLRHWLAALQKQEIQIRREGPQQVQDVVSAVVPQDALCLDARAELHGGPAVVQDVVALDSQRAARLPQQLHEPVVT